MSLKPFPSLKLNLKPGPLVEKMFVKHPSLAAAELLGQLLERACQGLQRLRQFEEDPDIADDTFLLASRVLSYSPKLLLSNPRLLAALLDSAQAGLLVQHR